MTTWLDFAACKGMDTSVFYPSNEEEFHVAVLICQNCKVRKACLEDALEDRQFGQFGVRGGRSESARRRLDSLRRKVSA